MVPTVGMSTVTRIRGLSESEDDRRFLQRRVALFSLAVGSAYFAFWIYRALALLIAGEPSDFRSPSFWLHLVAAGI